MEGAHVSRAPVLLGRNSVMRGAATVGKEYPEIRGALPSSAAILLTWIVRGYFADAPAEGEAHLQAIEALLMLRKRQREGVPMYDPKTGAPTAVGVNSFNARQRSAAHEVWRYLETHGIVAEPPAKEKPRKGRTIDGTRPGPRTR